MASGNGNTLPFQGMNLPEYSIDTNESGIVTAEKVPRIECVGQIALFGEGSIPSDRHLSSVK